MVVVGGGHNGLVAACYLAKAGLAVVVVEAADAPGGGSRTEERIPGYHFDTHSVAHNIINMTDIPAELELAGVGLEYVEMDPFSIAVHEDGRRVRFFRSVDKTVASIAETDRDEAATYREFMTAASPIVRAVLPAIRGDRGWRAWGARGVDIARALRTGPVARIRDVLAPYETLLARRLRSDLTRAPVAAFAAHAGVGPTIPGGALFAFWQAAYHLFGQWHAVGGAQGLTDALVARATSLGVEIRCGDAVERIDVRGQRARGVETERGERVDAAVIVTALDPKVALLELLEPPLEGRVARDLAATRRSNVVQALVHVAVDALPPYQHSRPGDWNGLQSYVDRLDDLVAGWVAADAGLLPDPLPLYGFTTSAIDDQLAPDGHHTLYLACPSAPARLHGGWDSAREAFADRAIATVEARAPGFRSTIHGVRTWTPDEMEQHEHWPGAHPMHLDIALDQLGPLRPTRALGAHRTPVAGLYVSGAGTNPTGGIAGTPGKLAAEAVLADR